MITLPSLKVVCDPRGVWAWFLDDTQFLTRTFILNHGDVILYIAKGEIDVTGDQWWIVLTRNGQGKVLANPEQINRVE